MTSKSVSGLVEDLLVQHYHEGQPPQDNTNQQHWLKKFAESPITKVAVDAGQPSAVIILMYSAYLNGRIHAINENYI